MAYLWATGFFSAQSHGIFQFRRLGFNVFCFVKTVPVSLWVVLHEPSKCWIEHSRSIVHQPTAILMHQSLMSNLVHSIRLRDAARSDNASTDGDRGIATRVIGARGVEHLALA